MSQDSLTSRYRPQTFAQVVGQDAIKRILSRSAAVGRVAPAYLLSGTRGVGKTTLARIFAKALNCEHGPGAEPCNACSFCRQITLGAAVDVVEIDGASNTGVDHVRRLKEDVGYAPLEGRFKVIIIDEAHMLSKAAFNALLKTLEEPPRHVTFILATTEPEKFPQTIISRCQHLVFKRLPQNVLAAHLQAVLNQENVLAEASAINLLARRGAGSVRDSMSLLAQVMALGADHLTLAEVRAVLGLAGQEVFMRLAHFILERDVLGLQALLTEILDLGVDLGFFLRELGACWRNLFLLGHLGPQARDIIDLPAEEVQLWAELAPKFTLSHVHAAWQMTLESQRQVLTSMEPALALELLLLNLAFLPELLAVGTQGVVAGGPAPGHTLGRGATPKSMAQGAPPSRAKDLARPAAQISSAGSAPIPRPAATAPGLEQKTFPDSSEPKHTPPNIKQDQPAAARSASFGQSRVAPAPVRSVREEPADITSDTSKSVPPEASPKPSSTAPTWEGFVAFCQRGTDRLSPVPGLDKCVGTWREQELILCSGHTFLCKRLGENLARITDLARAYFGKDTQVRIEAQPAQDRPTRPQLLALAKEDTVVREVQEIFQAKIIHARPPENTNSKEKDQ